MKTPLPLAIVLSLSLITATSAQSETESPEEAPPAQAAELPDIPPAPPETTTEPSASPDASGDDQPAGDDTEQSDGPEPQRHEEPGADRNQPDRFENEWDARFGARFDIDPDGRFVVRSIVDESLAARTGLRADDILLSVDGQTFDTEPDLRAYLRAHSDDRIPITVLRDGTEQTVYLHDGGAGGAARPALGVRFFRGPVLEVIDVIEGSPADQAGVVPGDRIVSMNGDQFGSTDAFLSAVAHADVDQSVELVVNRNGEIIVDRIRLDAWEEVFDTPGTTVTTLRPDLNGNGVDVITPGHAHVHPAAYGYGCGYPYWTGYRYGYWPYWTTAYAGPYFYAPYSGPIYYGPAYTYWPVNVSWRYPVYAARVW